MKQILFFVFSFFASIGYSQDFADETQIRSDHFPDGVLECDSLWGVQKKLIGISLSVGFDDYTDSAKIELWEAISWVDYLRINCIGGEEVEMVTGYDPSVMPRTNYTMTKEAANNWMYFRVIGSKWVWRPLESSYEGFMAYRVKKILAR